MSKKRWQALVLAGAVLMSMFLGGCKTSQKEKEKNSKSDKKAEAMLDDFCAYLKSGKYEKMDKLIDGESKSLETLKGYDDSEAKEVHTAARKRLSYSIENVTTDEKKDSGEATLVITYFDVKDLKKKIKEGDTAKDIARAVEKAKEIDLEFDVDLVLDDDWLIDSGSVDMIVDELYSFMEDLDLEVKPTEPTKSAKTLTEFSSAWYDINYNEVEGFHESDSYICYEVMLWECCYGETVTYEFEDENGQTYSGECVIDNGDDIIFCTWYPTAKLATGYISCYVYDATGGLVSVGCCPIYADGETIPVTNVYIYSVKFVDEDGQLVPGYHLDDTYFAVQLQMGNYDQQVDLRYELQYYDGKNGSYTTCTSGDVSTNGEEALIEFKDFAPQSTGLYELYIYNAKQECIWYAYFNVIEQGEEFPCDENNASEYQSWWAPEDGSWTELTSISASDTEVYFYMETYSYYNYMEFPYTITDGNGKVFQEGKIVIISSDRADYLKVDVSDVSTGPIVITVLNPDGSVFVEKSLSVK